MEERKEKISPCLWFDDQAEEAAAFYTSVFTNSAIKEIARYGKEGFEFHRKPEGSAMTVSFELDGQEFVALNGGPHFKFNPSVSFFAICETSSELDEVWRKLSDRGEILMPLDKYEWSEKYGWLQDKYGISWQIALGKIDEVGQKFTPSLLFVGDRLGQAKEAVYAYTSIFKNSEIDGILYYGPGEPQSEGLVKHAQFSLNGSKFMVMDSSLEHSFTFNEAISLIIHCKTQAEVDHYWDRLSEGGDPNSQQCGWLKDKFGVSWQVVPVVLEELLKDKDSEKRERVTAALLKMKKLEIEPLLMA